MRMDEQGGIYAPFESETIRLETTPPAPRPALAARGARVAGRGLRGRGEVWKFISPALVCSLVFLLYPVGYSLYISLYRTQGLRSEFVGLGNIQRMLGDSTFFQALGNNFVYLLFQVPAMLVMGLLFASILNAPRLRFRAFFRTALFLPCVTSLVAYSVLFKMLFQQGGLINQALVATGITGAGINWLNDPFWAKVTIILALCWRWTGYNMMFFLSGLQNIPDTTREAAAIDGANSVQIFFRVIVPQLKPVILFTTILSTIGTVQLFDEVVNLTEGGPSGATMTASQLIYNHSFVYTSNFGYAATLSWVLVLIVALLALVQFRVMREKP